MRRAFWALMACAAASTTGALPAAARDYPFCIKGCDFGAGRGDCSFSSLQQCQATAAGSFRPILSIPSAPQPTARPDPCQKQISVEITRIFGSIAEGFLV